MALAEFNEEPFILTGGKWFDGYTGQKMIIIDDLDKYTAHVLAHSLKLWSDRYPVTAEIKGGTLPLQHRVIVVTSNLTIEEAFKADNEKATSM